MKYQIDQSGKIEQTSKDTVIALSNGKSEFSIVLPRKAKRALQSIFRLQRKPDMFIYFTFSALIALLFKNIKAESLVSIDIEYPGKNDLIKAKIIEYLNKLQIKIIPNMRFSLVGKHSPAHELATKIAHKKLKPSKKLTLEEVEEVIFSQKKIGYFAINETKGNLSQDWLPVGRKPSQSLVKSSYHRKAGKSR